MHQLSINFNENPVDKRITAVQENISRNIMAHIDGIEKKYVCFPCKQTVLAVESHVNRHIKCQKHRIAVNHANYDESIQIGFGNSRSIGVVDKKISESNGIFTTERTEENYSLIKCNICIEKKPFKVLNRLQDLNRHIATKEHSMKEVILNENPDLNMNDLQIAYELSQMVETASALELSDEIEIHQDEESSKFVFYCKFCKSIISQRTNCHRLDLLDHIKTNKHRNNVPKYNMYSDNQFFEHMVEWCIAGNVHDIMIYM